MAKYKNTFPSIDDILSDVQDDIANSGIEAECPSCNKEFVVNSGSNKCPYCGHEFNAEFDFSDFKVD